MNRDQIIKQLTELLMGQRDQALFISSRYGGAIEVDEVFAEEDEEGYFRSRVTDETIFFAHVKDVYLIPNG